MNAYNHFKILFNLFIISVIIESSLPLDLTGTDNHIGPAEVFILFLLLKSLR